MDENEPSSSGNHEDNTLIVALLASGFLIWAGLIGGVARNDERLLLALLAVPFGALAIFVAVRLLNRRDDPRGAKTPPDDN